MFEYKKGDKVRCKKFFKDINNYIQFYNGSEYIIYNTYILYDVEVLPNEFSSSNHIDIKSRKLTYSFNREKFYEHFYSKKELRKLKLNKIQKNV